MYIYTISREEITSQWSTIVDHVPGICEMARRKAGRRGGVGGGGAGGGRGVISSTITQEM